jgi:hypothetical protein|tara:strand:+ start:1110 stop:1241 length:132 start_codon:yes stop_codon:yes gene_type:complete
MSVLKNLVIIGLFVSVYVAVSPAFANDTFNLNEYATKASYFFN